MENKVNDPEYKKKIFFPDTCKSTPALTEPKGIRFRSPQCRKTIVFTWCVPKSGKNCENQVAREKWQEHKII